MNAVITVETVEQCDAALKERIGNNLRGFLDHLTSAFYQRNEQMLKKRLKPEFWSIGSDQIACDRYADLWSAIYNYGKAENPIMEPGKRYYYTEDAQLDASRVEGTLKSLYSMLKDDYEIGGRPAKTTVLEIGSLLGIDINTSPALHNKR